MEALGWMLAEKGRGKQESYLESPPPPTLVKAVIGNSGFWAFLFFFRNSAVVVLRKLNCRGVDWQLGKKSEDSSVI